jgi:hypothetical protein
MTDPPPRLGLTIVAFLVSYAVLSVLAGILLVITNTLYMCYILDLDHQETFTPGGKTQEIHAIYKLAIEGRIASLRSNPKARPMYHETFSTQHHHTASIQFY